MSHFIPSKLRARALCTRSCEFLPIMYIDSAACVASSPRRLHIAPRNTPPAWGRDSTGVSRLRTPCSYADLAFSEPSLPASEVADEPPTLTKEEPVPLETQVRRCFGFPSF